jgi:ribonuclease D
MLHKSINKEEIDLLPVKLFEGKIIVVENHQTLQKIITYLKHQKFLGFDTESKPSFKKGQKNGVALLQLSTTDTAVLFRLNRIGLPSELSDLLSDEKILKIGVAIRDDIKTIQHLKQFQPKGFIELQTYVKQFNIECISLKHMAAIVLGFKISKRQRMSNWETDVLTSAQQQYASIDAWACLEIYTELERRLIQMSNRSQIVSH